MANFENGNDLRVFEDWVVNYVFKGLVCYRHNFLIITLNGPMSLANTKAEVVLAKLKL